MVFSHIPSPSLPKASAPPERRFAPGNVALARYSSSVSRPFRLSRPLGQKWAGYAQNSACATSFWIPTPRRSTRLHGEPHNGWPFEVPFDPLSGGPARPSSGWGAAPCRASNKRPPGPLRKSALGPAGRPMESSAQAGIPVLHQGGPDRPLPVLCVMRFGLYLTMGTMVSSEL